MVMLRRLKIIAVAITIAIISGVIVIANYKEPALAVDLCVSDACKEAAAREADARQKAADANAAATSLEEAVQGLELEIYALEAKIKSNEAIAADLALKIQINEEKLEIQKAALASLLVDTYFESNPDTILLLAGSNSISDLTEKQTRAENVKQQINISAKNIKSVKQELESDKGEVDRLVVDKKNQKEVVKQKRDEQNRLIAQYRDNAENYSAEATAARIQKEKQIAEEVARLVEEKFPKLDGKVLINNIGGLIGAHTGPGTVALFFWGDERTA